MSAIDEALDEIETHYILDGCTVVDAELMKIKDDARAELAAMREVIARADELATDVSCVVDRNPNKYDCEVDYKDIEAMRDGRDAYRAARESVKC